MKRTMKWFPAIVIALSFCFLSLPTRSRAYDDDKDRSFPRAPRCTNGTASGIYGYRMAGQILGAGPFLVNGIFTHNPAGTSSAEVQLTLGNQALPATGTNGTFTTNSDCSGSGKFRVPELNLDITYNFIVTDDGEQIELLNTNAGVILQGVARRIAKAGKEPRCTNGTVAGSYGYRLEGSLPNVPAALFVGTVTNTPGTGLEGALSGTDTANFMGAYVPRTITSGTYKTNSNCRGTGFYTDNLGNKVNYVFTAVDGGDTIYLQGADAGVAVSGVGRRIR